jgi:hypothetical protein
MFKTHKTLYIVLAIIAAAAAASFLLFKIGDFKRDEDIGATSATFNSKPPTNWLTYKSPDITFKYPATWSITGDADTYTEMHIRSADSKFDISISHWKTIAQAACNTLAECKTADYFLSGTIQELKIGGKPAIRGIVDAGHGSTTKPIPVGAIYILIDNSHGYSMTYQPVDSSFVSTFDQILTTFKFTPSAPSPTTIDQDIKGTSGIMGMVTIGPTCPVMRNPPDPQCADKPYAANLEVKDSSGKIVKTFSSAADGSFSVDLAPGNYTIVGTNVTMPRMSPVNVTVEEGKFASLNIQFDSGIR